MFRPLLLTLVLSALSGPALAGPPSSLVNASFIDGAEIVTNTPALAQFAASLRQVAANVNGQCKQSEYVVWPSRDGLETQFRQGLESLNYRFGVLTTDNENGYVMAFQAKGAQTTLVGLWVDVDGTTVLGWCSLAALAADTGAPSTTPATWPAFGTFQVGDTVQFYTSIGWKQGIIKEVGPGPGQPAGDRWHAVKKYLITRTESHAQISTVTAGRNGGAAWLT